MSVVLTKPRDLEELVLIEMQGTLEQTDPSTTREGKLVGEMTIDAKGNPNIVMGNHTLEGVFVNLKKPLALVKKTTKTIPHGLRHSTVCEVQGLIKRKALFSTRPAIHIPSEYIKVSKTVTKKKK